MTPTIPDHQTPAALLDQEQHLTFDALDEVVCYRIGSFIADQSVRDSRTVTVVVYLGERLVYKAGLPGTNARNDMVIEGKRRVSLLDNHASLYERNRHLEAGTTFEAATELPAPDYLPYGGCVPLLSTSGAVLGLVIVSGLTQEEDHDLSIAGIASVREER